jgi:hypothetical protein
MRRTLRPYRYLCLRGQDRENPHIVREFVRCGKPSCRCAHEQKHRHGPYVYLRYEEQLGHASIKLTVDTYGRWLPIGNKAAVDRLDDARGGSKTVAATGGGARESSQDGQLRRAVGLINCLWDSTSLPMLSDG